MAGAVPSRMSTGAERQREVPNGSGASEAGPPLPRASRAVMRRFHASVPGELRIRLSQPTQCETLRSGQGDAAPPLEPPTSRAAAGAASGGCRRREPRRRCAPRGPPHRHGGRPHAAYEVAATDDGAEANVDRACTRH